MGVPKQHALSLFWRFCTLTCRPILAEASRLNPKPFNRKVRKEELAKGAKAEILFAIFAGFLGDLCGEKLFPR